MDDDNVLPLEGLEGPGYSMEHNRDDGDRWTMKNEMTLVLISPSLWYGEFQYEALVLRSRIGGRFLVHGFVEMAQYQTTIPSFCHTVLWS